MPKFKYLLTVVAIWCSPVPLAMANTVVLDIQTLTYSPTEQTTRVLASFPEPTPASTPPVNSLLITLRRWFGY